MKSEFFLPIEKTEEYIIERSKFIAYAYPCDSKEKAQELLKALKRKHLQATHICYAYRVLEGNLESIADELFNYTQSYFDDGEPSGTAGAPILRAIEESELYNVLIAVVRYFGGIKLGAAGLTKAYKTASLMAIEKKKVELKTIYKLECDYSLVNSVINVCNNKQIDVIEKTFDMLATFTVASAEDIFDSFDNKVQISVVGKQYL